MLPLLTPSSQPCDPNHLSGKLSDLSLKYLNSICLVLLGKAESSIRAVKLLVCFVPVCPETWDGRGDPPVPTPALPMGQSQADFEGYKLPTPISVLLFFLYVRNVKYQDLMEML